MFPTRTSPVLRALALTALLAGLACAQQVPEILYYKFNEGSGSSTANLAVPGSGFANAPVTGHSLSPTGGQFAGSLVGSSNSNGTNDVNSGWTTNLGSGSWTIGFWINLNGTVGGSTTVMYMFGDPTAGPTNGAFRCFANSQAGAGDVMVRGPMNEIGTVGGAIASGGHYVHYVYNSSTQTTTVWVDGTLNNSVSQSGGLNITGSGTFRVAGFTGNSSQSLRNGCRMDEFRVYNRALSASEIGATWNTTLSPTGVFANFTGTPTSGSTPLTVNFTDTSTSTSGPVNSWLWDFGDGTMSTQQNPSHTYTLPGSYDVSLTAGDGINPSNTRTITDYITSGPYGFDMQTTGGGVGDLTITTAPSPPGTTEGFTFFSHTPASPLGTGNFFGINFDDYTAFSFMFPAPTPGNIFHFTPTPGQYPAVPFFTGPGTLSSIAGMTVDGLVVYVVNGQLVMTSIDRVTF